MGSSMLVKDMCSLRLIESSNGHLGAAIGDRRFLLEVFSLSQSIDSESGGVSSILVSVRKEREDGEMGAVGLK